MVVNSCAASRQGALRWLAGLSAKEKSSCHVYFSCLSCGVGNLHLFAPPRASSRILAPRFAAARHFARHVMTRHATSGLDRLCKLLDLFGLARLVKSGWVVLLNASSRLLAPPRASRHDMSRHAKSSVAQCRAIACRVTSVHVWSCRLMDLYWLSLVGCASLRLIAPPRSSRHYMSLHIRS